MLVLSWINTATVFVRQNAVLDLVVGKAADCEQEPRAPNDSARHRNDDAAAATPVLPSREEVEPSPESLAMQQMLEETAARTDELLTCVCRVVHLRNAAALTVLSVGRLHAQQHQEGIRLRWSLSQCAKKT